MSNVLRPVGPEPPKVYWIRRLVVVALVVLLVVIVASLFSGGGGDGADPSASPTPTEDVTEDPSQTPDEDADAADAEAVDCLPENLTVALTPATRVWTVGTAPTFTATVTNTGSTPCTVDTGADHVELLVTSGSDRIWSSVDCPSETAEASRLRLLRPGAEDVDPAVVWPGVRSAEECPTGLPTPRAGTYRAVLTVGEVASEAAVIELQ